MGVPVTFSEINNIAAIAEIAYKDGSLIPDLSFGTHFFQDLVEMDIFYNGDLSGQGGGFFRWLICPNGTATMPRLCAFTMCRRQTCGFCPMSSRSR
jgi:hypothetical protein